MEKSDLASFGELLKAYRKQQGLTQRQVARKLAIHHNTVGAWERGDYLPATRGQILELAHCLYLNEEETYSLLDASLITVVSRWSVPHLRNPFFTGRQALLEQLHTLLSEDQGLVTNRSCALSGMGGIGKTQTAIEYAYRYSLDYTSVFWINAETEAGLLGSFAAVARILKLPVSYTQKQEEIVMLVLDWFNSHRDWLLIFDNVEERELVTRFVPSSQNGACLFTTRLPTLGILAPCLALEPLPLEESIQLLLSRAGAKQLHQPSLPISADEEMAAQSIARAMDGLPLALDQAAAYIEESHCRFVGFLSLFQQDALHMLQEHPSSVVYSRSVETTFRLAFERLQAQDPVAADLLTLCCFLAPDAIPEELLIKGRSYLNSELQIILSDPFRLNDTFKSLLTYALLHRNTQTETFSIHRLIQTVLREKLSEEIQRAWIERIIRMLDHLFLIEQDRLDAEHWAWDEQLLPHAQRIFQLADHLKLASPEFGSLLRKTATYLFQRARYEQAETFYLRAIAIQKQVPGTSHPDLALALSGLASTHHQQGKYQEVEAFYQQAISLIEGSLEPEHLQLALPLQGLAFFYQETTRYGQAEALYQRALHVCTQALGSDHPDVATALHNLAACYLVQGYTTQAEPLYLRALRIREQTLHHHHPDIGASLNDLALLYYYQARYQEAEHLYLRSLSFCEETLGIDHPDVAAILNNLARLYYLQARYEQAEPLYLRALHMREQIFGADHPYTAFFVNNLASLYGDQGRYQESEAFASRALAIYQQKLDASSHIIASPLHNLAQIAYQQGRYQDAEAFSSHALAILERTLPDHPMQAETLHLHANVRRMQGSYEDAALLYQRALSVYQKALGPEHIRVAMLIDDIGMLHWHQGRWAEAEQHYQEALHIWERYQELRHPAHADCLEHYVKLLEQQQRQPEADVYCLQARKMRAWYQAASQVIEHDLPASIGTTNGENAVSIDQSPELNNFEAFLRESCVLSAQAICRTSDLWRAYQQWATEKSTLLSRQAFTFQLKARGCRLTRIKAHSTWQGVRLKNQVALS